MAFLDLLTVILLPPPHSLLFFLQIISVLLSLVCPPMASFYFPLHSIRFLFSSTHIPWPVHAFPPCLTCCGLTSQPVLLMDAAAGELCDECQ